MSAHVTTRVPKSSCVCGHTFDAVTDVCGPVRAPPKPGDATVCFRCARAWQFTDSLGLAPLDVESLPEEHRKAVRKVQSRIITFHRSPS